MTMFQCQRAWVGSLWGDVVRVYPPPTSSLRLHTLTTQRPVEQLDRDGDELPASRTDLFVLTARSDLIVICHVDIKDELASQWLQGRLQLLTLVLWSSIVDGPDLEPGWVETDELLLEVQVGGERVVALQVSSSEGATQVGGQQGRRHIVLCQQGKTTASQRGVNLLSSSSSVEVGAIGGCKGNTTRRRLTR